MVSVMLMPARVAEASLPASRSCTRVRFTRFLERYRATARFSKRDAMPISVITAL